MHQNNIDKHPPDCKPEISNWREVLALLDKERQEKDITYEALGKMVDKSKQAAQAFLDPNRKKPPTIEVLEKYAKALDFKIQIELKNLKISKP